MREDQLALRILSGSSGLTGAVCAALLLAYWPPSTPEEDPLEQARRLQLGPSGPGRAIAVDSFPSSPDRVILGDLDAMRRYARVEPEQLAGAGFEWLDAPLAGSWRAGPGRQERHQDFLAYTREQFGRVDLRRKVLVLRSVGPWPRERRDLIPIITRYLMIYFQRPVRWEDPLPLPDRYRLNRDGSAEHLQYPTRPILAALRRDLPPDALAAVGITAQDIFPAATWGFVFGLADLQDRVAVVSYRRLHPEFWGNEATPAAKKRATLRVLRVLAHEIGHTLGANHCVTMRCALNGCNSLSEQDDAPVHLCPVCLAKLGWKLDWRVTARYAGLSHLLYKLGYPRQANWYRRQYDRLRPPDPLPEVSTLPRRVAGKRRGRASPP